ncbi:MAG: flagellar basal body rod protein FlgB [Aquificae bacterium]|nr:flagellar basal body rod protein FlgB [Aquificota bacterium]
MNEIFKHLNILDEKASYFLERTKIIQGNIANADTPFYKPKDLLFEKELNKQIKLKKTHPKHIQPEENDKKFKIIELNDVSGYDENKVNLDKELAKLAETSIMYKTLLETIKKEMAKMKYAINGR